MIARLLVTVTVVTACSTRHAQRSGTGFDPRVDLVSLHYDHAPDRDDGHSAAADRTVLESLFGADWIGAHVVAVSGTYGTNAADFNPRSDEVMDAAWRERGGWVSAHRNREETLDVLTARWLETLQAGGQVWVKEGGQSDITAAVVQRIARRLTASDTRRRIHVVQHSDWNERHTRPEALRYTKEHTDYVRIRDANAYLDVRGGDSAFVAAALAHPIYGEVWERAFAYYDPAIRLDFSDTGELLHILGIGELDIAAFRRRFVEP